MGFPTRNGLFSIGIIGNRIRPLPFHYRPRHSSLQSRQGICSTVGVESMVVC